MMTSSQLQNVLLTAITEAFRDAQRHNQHILDSMMCNFKLPPQTYRFLYEFMVTTKCNKGVDSYF